MKTIFFTLLLMPFLGVAQSNSKDLTKKQILKNKNVIDFSKQEKQNTETIYFFLTCQKKETSIPIKELPLISDKLPKLSTDELINLSVWNEISKKCKEETFKN